MKRRRIPFLFVLLALLLAACGTGSSGQTKIADLPTSGPTISPFLTGLWGPGAKGGQPDQLTPYIKWFRSDVGDGTPPEPSGAIVDPVCPLEYDYQTMASSKSEWQGGWDALGIRAINGARTSGFYNPGRQETLIILKGHTFDIISGTNGHCNSDDFAVYVPVRLNMGTGQWIVDGFASPAATITITATTGMPMAELKNDHEINDVHTIVSPLRLKRFQITEENWARVMDYATLNDNRQGKPRRIVWFRTSDIAPSFAQHATSTCTVGFFAFWGQDGNKDFAPCGSEQKSDFGSNDSMYLDRMGRMSGKYELTGPVTEQSGDDICSRLSASSCAALTNDQWSGVAKDLFLLVRQDDAGIAQRKGAVTRIKKLLEDKGMLADNTPPDALGGWDGLDSDVFGIIASGGETAANDTRNAIKDNTELQGLVGFIGQAATNPQGDYSSSVTLSPSFSFEEISTDAKAKAFYDKYSLLMNGGKGKSFNVMSFSTAASAHGLEYQQSPIERLKIVVSDSLDGANKSEYISNWLPMMALGRNAGGTAVRENIDLIGNFPGAVSRAISDLVWSIYRGTVGSWMSSLSQIATSNLLAVPTLEPYKISYLRGDGTPVYELQKDLIKWDHVIYKEERAGTRAQAVPPTLAAAGLSADELTCSKAAIEYLLGDPANVVQVGVKSLSVDVCYEKNPTYILFQATQGLMLLMFLFLVARYFLGVAYGGDKPRITKTGFFARMIFVLGLTLGMGAILRILSLFVAEAVLVTNLLGSQISGGAPYSHLWLFTTYLNSPTHDMNPFALLILAPFSLLGLLALLAFSLLRNVIVLYVVAISPFWVLSLLAQREPTFFYKSLRWLLQLYIIPLLTLVGLLGMFVVAKALGVGTDPGGSLLGAVLGMLMMIALAIIPFFGAKYVVGVIEGPIAGVIRAALHSADESGLNTQLNAATSWRDSGAKQLGGPAASGEDSAAQLGSTLGPAEYGKLADSDSGGGSKRVHGGDGEVAADAWPVFGDVSDVSQVPASEGSPGTDNPLALTPSATDKDQLSLGTDNPLVPADAILKGKSGRYRIHGGALTAEKGLSLTDRLRGLDAAARGDLPAARTLLDSFGKPRSLDGKLHPVYDKDNHPLLDPETHKQLMTPDGKVPEGMTPEVRRSSSKLLSTLTGSRWISEGLVDESSGLGKAARFFDRHVTDNSTRLLESKSAEWNQHGMAKRSAEEAWKTKEVGVRRAEEQLSGARRELRALYATPKEERDPAQVEGARTAVKAAAEALRLDQGVAADSYRAYAQMRGAPLLFKISAPGAMLAERRLRREQLGSARGAALAAESALVQGKVKLDLAQRQRATATAEARQAAEQAVAEQRAVVRLAQQARETAQRELSQANNPRSLAAEREKLGTERALGDRQREMEALQAGRRALQNEASNAARVIERWEKGAARDPETRRHADARLQQAEQGDREQAKVEKGLSKEIERLEGRRQGRSWLPIR